LKKQNSLTKPTNGLGTVVFDLEANGLLNDATRIHCVVLHYLKDNHTETHNDESPGEGMSNPIHRAVQHLALADVIVGHNIIGYDLPLLKKFYPFFDPSGIIVDTLLLSRLYHPNLFDIDKRHNWKHMSLQLYGRHSLEAYGYRLNEYKGSFSKNTDWKEWSQEMQDYCEQDVVVTTKLCKHFLPYLNGSR